MFEDPPGCFMHRQASFITAFFPEDTESGVDYDWFPMPGESQQPTLFAGELAVVVLEPAGGRGLPRAVHGRGGPVRDGDASPGARGSPRTSTSGRTATRTRSSADASEVLTAALAGEGAAGFDASDQMPPQVGSGSFWTEMMGYMQDGPDSLQTHLENIEASWPT